MTEEDEFEAAMLGAELLGLFEYETTMLARVWEQLGPLPWPQEVKVAYMKRIIERLGVT